MENMKIFALNIGSTSTKIALFNGKEKLYEGKAEHDPAELTGFKSIIDQKDLRVEGIERTLEQAGLSLDGCTAIVARCGHTQTQRGSGRYHRRYARPAVPLQSFLRGLPRN